MSFTHDYPNRKDRRKPYRRSGKIARGCRPNGSCGYCRGNRLYCTHKREAARPDPREQPADIDDDTDDADDDDHDPYCPRA